MRWCDRRRTRIFVARRRPWWSASALAFSIWITVDTPYFSVLGLVTRPARALVSAREDVDEPRPLELRERPRLQDLHGVAELRLALFVVRVELAVATHVLLVFPVLLEPGHLDHDGLFHLVRDDEPDDRPARAALAAREL